MDITPPQLPCKVQKKIMDFLFSGALNGPLNSNFLKEQIYVIYPEYAFLTAQSIYNIYCGVQVESLVHRNNLGFTTKRKPINLGYLKAKNENFGNF